jgi:chaperonin GroES
VFVRSSLSPSFLCTAVAALVSNRTMSSFTPKFSRVASSNSRMKVRASAATLPSKFTTVKPSGDRVLVKIGAAEAKTPGGILLPTSAEQAKNEGTVVDVGDVETIKAGDEIMYSRYAGMKVKVGDVEHIIMKATDVIGTKGGSIAELKPTEDRILVKLTEDEGSTAGGVILTSASSEKPSVGEVLAVGPGSKGEDGEIKAPSIKVGDQVLYSKFSGVDLEDGDDKFVVVRSTDVLAVLS